MLEEILHAQEEVKEVSKTLGDYSLIRETFENIIFTKGKREKWWRENVYFCEATINFEHQGMELVATLSAKWSLDARSVKEEVELLKNEVISVSLSANEHEVSLDGKIEPFASIDTSHYFSANKIGLSEAKRSVEKFKNLAKMLNLHAKVENSKTVPQKRAGAR